MNRFDKYRGKSGNLVPASGINGVPATSEERQKIYGDGKAKRSVAIDQALNRTHDFAICLDATGSMSHLLDAAKASIDAIIAGVIEHAQTKVRLKLFVYRDYDVPTRVLESSPLTSDPNQLTGWLRGVGAEGGGGNDGEAIEQALKAAFSEQTYSGVLLAGDEPPNSRADLNSRGKSTEPTALDWARRFGEKGIAIHTFVVGNSRKTTEDFKSIGRLSGGQSGKLDGSKEMIDMAVMAILAKLKGAAAVTRYGEGRRLSSNAQSFQQLLLSGPK
jgi:hypothetical protein